jgi:hypothetical protein
VVHRDWIPLEVSVASVGRFAIGSVKSGATLLFRWP